MGKSAKAPTPPDPVATANAQTDSNVDTAVANSWLQNPTVNSPYGTTSSTRTGTQWVDGREIPTFTQNTTLSPVEQTLFDQQTQLGTKTNDLALQQVGRIGSILGTAAPQLSDYLGDPTTVRNRVESALFQRLEPSLSQASDQLETKLTNQGLVRGTTAFNTADDAQNRTANDARLAVVAQAGTEQDRAYAEAQQQLQDATAARNEPINQLAAIAGYGQVQAPAVTPYQPGTVAGTPVAQIIESNYQDQLSAWKTEQANKQATLGSIFGLGSAALGGWAQGGFKTSDRRLKRDVRPLGVKLRTGIPLYRYRLAGSDHIHVGVMADEVIRMVPEAVLTRPNGFAAVDYGMIV